jgi:RHS repeat-associated protein
LVLLDFVGGQKPYLLTSSKNSLGLTTTVTYASSTKFYLADRAAGKPWATRLPFPVHVVESVMTYDAVARVRLTKQFAFHHGAYDPDEREFRGFGAVESWDTEAFAAVAGSGILPTPTQVLNGELAQPPVRTKTWYHTGVWRGGESIEAAYQREYYSPTPGVPDPRLLPPSTIVDAPSLANAPTQLRLSELKQATRALKGAMLHQEVYADDGTAKAGLPYSVTHARYEVVRLQPASGLHGAVAEQAVFLTHDKEGVSTYYERNPLDPRIQHHATIEVDDFGAVKRSMTVAYGRATGLPEQQKQWSALSENDLLHLPNATTGYRLGIPLAGRLYELTGLSVPAAGQLLGFDVLKAAADAASPIAYEASPTTGLQKRLVAYVKHRYYDSTALPNPLPFGSADTLALGYESYALSLTPGLLTSVFATDVTPAILSEGGYVTLPGETGYFVPSGRALPNAAKFYLPSQMQDPFGNVTTLTYDTYNLFSQSVTDPLGNSVSATFNYRVLAPALVTDPNGNRAAAAFDAMGHVTATAVMGKVGGSEGDTLANPTVKFTYDWLRYSTPATAGLPAYVKTEAREQHGANPGRWLTTYAYSDGSGRVAMVKAQAEPGYAPLRYASGALQHDVSGNLVFGPVATRWVGNGKTVVNNKGNPIKQYEPFFSSTFEYENEDELVQWGVTAVVHYDPLGRAIRTDLPHGGTRRIDFDGWQETAYDENDTLGDAGNIWFAARQVGASPAPTTQEQRAATLAYAHRNTPATTVLDSLGRAFLVKASLTTATTVDTKTTLDIEGQPLVVTDALGRACQTTVFGVDGKPLKQVSIDAGERRTFTDVAGAPIRTWGQRGFVHRMVYDQLRRLTHRYVAAGAAAETLADRLFYGELLGASAATTNHRGRALRSYDSAGEVQALGYDFKGNTLQGSRRVANAYTTQPDWTALANLTTTVAIDAAVASLVSSEVFSSSTTYDALNRPMVAISPDASQTRHTYNEAGLLDAIDIRLRGAATWSSVIANVDYDAKGRRTNVQHGNGTVSTYVYDPLSLRLTQIQTVRTSGGAVLQNLRYTYDCVGNIAQIEETAQQTVFFNNAVVDPTTLYEYDALYRLTKASGRELAGGLSDQQRDQNDTPLVSLPHANNTQAVRTYVETYVYDAVGNFLRHVHDGGLNGSWTRYYDYQPLSNRLKSTSLPGDAAAGPYSATYTHDAHGNIVAMPHLATITWDDRDQMASADKGGGGLVYFNYDASGQRVRKVWVHSGIVEERIYLGSYEVYRRRVAGAVEVERQTLHVNDVAGRVLMVETKTIDTTIPAFTPVTRWRFQLSNHLGSASLEVSEAAAVISYEEYHPFGTTAYRSSNGDVEVSAKRYRYTGKERDEETGFGYHGARYLALWLGRWGSADPSGLVDGANLYQYCRGNPVGLLDPTGMQANDEFKVNLPKAVSLPKLKDTLPKFSDYATGYHPRPAAPLFQYHLPDIDKPTPEPIVEQREPLLQNANEVDRGGLADLVTVQNSFTSGGISPGAAAAIKGRIGLDAHIRDYSWDQFGHGFLEQGFYKPTTAFGMAGQILGGFAPWAPFVNIASGIAHKSVGETALAGAALIPVGKLGKLAGLGSAAQHAGGGLGDASASIHIALGLTDTNTHGVGTLGRFASAVGAIPHTAWEDAGLAVAKSKTFEDFFYQAAKNADWIHFNLDGIEGIEHGVAAVGANGFHQMGQVTMAELTHVLQNPSLLNKTTFYLNRAEAAAPLLLP